MGGNILEPSIRCVNVRKDYRGLHALENISFDVDPGIIYGVLGPNGAGKSTLLRVLSGLVNCSSGQVRVLGRDPWKERRMLVGRVGVLLDAAFPRYLTGRQNIELLAKIGGQTKAECEQSLRYVGLESVAGRPSGSYSFGMMQRLGLAQALLGNPELLLLDEPLVGLDPIGIDEFKQRIKDLATKGTTVIFSNHQLADVEDICEQVTVINKGKTIFIGSVREATRSSGYLISVDSPEDALISLKLQSLNATLNGQDLIVSVSRGPELANVISCLSDNRYKIYNVEPIRNTLKDMFKTQIERE